MLLPTREAYNTKGQDENTKKKPTGDKVKKALHRKKRHINKIPIKRGYLICFVMVSRSCFTCGTYRNANAYPSSLSSVSFRRLVMVSVNLFKGMALISQNELHTCQL